MIKKLLKYLEIEQLGLLEIVIALYPILAGYGYGSFQLAFGVLLILDILILVSGNRSKLNNAIVTIFLSYIIIHDFFFLFVIPEIKTYYVNSMIATIIYVASLYIITPKLNYHKLRSAIMIVGMVCMGGMLYHVAMIASGYSISPIKLPLLPDMVKTTRLYAITDRPTSFFWEPQSYVSFMLVPMFIALKEKKTIIAFIIATTIFVSTSTTGLVMTGMMYSMFVFRKGGKIWNRLLILGAICCLGYFLTNSSYTASGLEKLGNTNLVENNRIINGMLIAQNMSVSDWLIGIPYPNEQDAYDCGYIKAPIIVMADGVVFISAFWVALIRYGLLCPILLLLIYYKIYKTNKEILPYLLCIIVALFSNPDFVGASFCFQLFFMFSFIMYAYKPSLNNIQKKTIQ